MIKEYKSISAVPAEHLPAICDNMFFSEDYANCVAAEGRKLFILASQTHMIPFVLTQKLCFRYGSFAYQPVPLCAEAEGSAREFLDVAVEYLAKKKHVHFINPTPAYTYFEDCPTQSQRIPFGNHVCDLTVSEDALLMKMHSKHRNCVRKAQKDGVVVKMGQDEALLSDYMQMDRETWTRSNKSSSGEAFYRSKLKAMPHNSMIFIAYKDDVPQSGALIYYDKTCGYYMFGANKNAPYNGAGNLLQWEIMLWLKSNGVKKYSFVGCRINEDEDSKYHGIQRFKERFGGELVQGYMFKCVCNTFMHALFLGIMKMRGASTSDVIDQEICKWEALNTSANS